MGLVIRTKAKETQKQLTAKTAARRQRHKCDAALLATLSAPAIVNDLVPTLVCHLVPIDQLHVAKRRPRKASKQHVGNVAKCIKTVGQVSPILIDRENHIVDGHVVVEALKLLGEKQVSAVRLDHLDKDQLALVQIALNKLAEGSNWQLEELRPMLDDLQVAGHDLLDTGFTAQELDIILQDDSENAFAESDDLIEPSGEPVSRNGDLWILGKHRLLCADALDGRSYPQALGMQQADACFTDPPWNIPIEGFVSGLGATKHKDFQMAAGEMSDETFQNFLNSLAELIATNLSDGGVLYSCIDWRSLDKMVTAGKLAGLTHINTIVWNKGSGGMGGLYRSAHELIPLFCKGNTPKTNNIELGRHGRDRTNVWSYAGANKPGSSAGKALKHHPTPKPVEMVEDALLDMTTRGELVLDPFMGSGTTLLAAERCGRVAAGIELEPAYVDVCIRRWQEMTGKVAILAGTGENFDQLARKEREEGIRRGNNDDE